MKQLFSRFIAVLIVALISAAALGDGAATADGFDSDYPESYESGGYQYILCDGMATITKYCGDANMLVIPDRLDGYPVAAIGGRAFLGCGNLKTVVIPEG